MEILNIYGVTLSVVAIILGILAIWQHKKLALYMARGKERRFGSKVSGNNIAATRRLWLLLGSAWIVAGIILISVFWKILNH